MWRQLGIVLSLLFCSTNKASGRSTQLRCQEGNDVQFRCPCCPGGFNRCRFKKLYEEGYVIYDGEVNRPSRYEFNVSGSHITLKECNISDGGVYRLLCTHCTDIMHFVLEVQLQAEIKIENSDESDESSR